MELLFKQYKRVVISLGLSLLFLISSEVCMGYQLSFTGLLFEILCISTFGYLVLFGILNRKKDQPFSQSWTSNELQIIPLIIGGICISGIYEAYPSQADFIAVFTLILVYTIIFTAVLLRNNYLVKKGLQRLSKSFINRIIFWSFAIGIGRIILIIEEYGDSDALIIVAFFYFPLLIFLITRWIFKQTRTIITLKNERAKTELLHLKSQVNPHFFFNMLNNLYGLVGTDAKKAQDLILKLSDMMRYSIYEGEKEMVTIEEEVDYMKNFIELHKMRYRKSIDVQFNVDIQNASCKVMPLLFIILLENAFKHGVENLTANAYVYVNIAAVGTDIQFSVENNFDPSEITKKPGIGLKNLKRRLELGYLNKHELAFTTEKSVHKVTLKLSLL